MNIKQLYKKHDKIESKLMRTKEKIANLGSEKVEVLKEIQEKKYDVCNYDSVKDAYKAILCYVKGLDTVKSCRIKNGEVDITCKKRDARSTKRASSLKRDLERSLGLVVNVEYDYYWETNKMFVGITKRFIKKAFDKKIISL